MTVGLRMHELRRRRGLTLEALAAQVGVHKAHLSRIERAEKAPSLGTLSAIAAALGVEMAELFGERAPQEDVLLVRRTEREILAGDGESYRVESLIPGTKYRSFSTYIVAPGPRFLEDDRPEHAGQKMVYVLSGAVQINLGERLVDLDEGDCIAFDANVRHRLRRREQTGTTVLVVIGASRAARTA